MVSCRPSALQSAHRIALGAICLAVTSGRAPAQTAGDQARPCLSGLNCTVSGDDADRIGSYVDGVVGKALNDAPAVDSDQPVVSAIVGVSWHGKRTYFGYGKNAPAYKPDTIVEIGSITKVFTTALLAEAVQDKGVSLDDPLKTYRDSIGLPGLTRCGASVTLRQLANFSSGMPRMPDALPFHHSIEAYSERQFKQWVSNWTPESASDGSCALPARYSYSNASIGLLGYIVSSQFGASYGRLIADRITTPLRMSSTFLPGEDGSVPDGVASRIAIGRANDYEPARPWPYYAWFAAGALRSDAKDMLSFGEAALGHPDIDGSAPSPDNQGKITSLESALRAAQMTTYPVRRPDGSLRFNQGLAWVQQPGDSARGLAPLHFKDGGTAGFSTLLIVDPAKDLAIFLAIGKTDMGIDQLGIRLARVIR